MKKEIIHQVYIIESPSENDLLKNRCEGKSLTEILTLQNIRHSYYLCISEDSFEKVVDIIIEDLNRLKEECFVWPIIHISSHGNPTQMIFSNGDLIEWTEIGNQLEKIHHQVFPEFDFSPVELVMSACYGYNASFCDISKENIRFSVVIGCDERIRWDASLVAFSSYYYNTIVNEINGNLAVECMNNSINEKEHFKVYISKKLSEMITQRGKKSDA
mgnify:CR=1 FL=1